MTAIEIAILIILILNNIKSITVGSNFSFMNYFRYGEDYMKWYTMRQKYIPPHKRQHFTKRSR